MKICRRCRNDHVSTEEFNKVCEWLCAKCQAHDRKATASLVTTSIGGAVGFLVGHVMDRIWHSIACFSPHCALCHCARAADDDSDYEKPT